MKKSIPPLLVLAALAFAPAAPVAAYDRVCVANYGLFVADLMIDRVDHEYPERVVLSRHHQNLNANAGQRRCLKTAGLMEPGATFRVLLDPQAGRDQRCLLPHEMEQMRWEENPGAPGVIGEHAGDGVMAWPGKGELEVFADGTTLHGSCRITKFEMWEGCKDHSTGGFSRHGCRPWQPKLFDHMVFAQVNWASPLGYVANALERGGDVNEMPNNYEAPLHVAARKWLPEHADFLLQRGADVNLRDARGQTPLVAALRANRHRRNLIQMAELLLQAGADPNLPDNNGDHPLHLAAASGHADVVAALLQRGANAAQTDDAGQTPLQRAEQAGQEKTYIALFDETLRLALESRDAPQKILQLARLAAAAPWLDINHLALGDTMLHRAAQLNDPEVVELLVKNGADPNIINRDGFAPMHLAAQTSRRVVRAMLAFGGSANLPDRDGRTPMHWAADPASPLHPDQAADIAAELAGAGGDPDRPAPNSGRAPLHDAASARANPAVLLAMLNAGGDPNRPTPRAGAPVHAAAEQGGPAVMQAILNNGGDHAARNRRGQTPLHIAAAEGRSGIVGILLEHGADPATRDENNLTPAAAADARGHQQAGDLLRAVAAPETLRDGGSAAIPAAVAGGSLRLLRELLSANADPNFQDDDGRTPLHHALLPQTLLQPDRRAEIVQELLTAGADPNLPDRRAVAPLHLAAQRDPDIVRLLLKNNAAPADPNARDENARLPLQWALDENAAPDRGHPADIVAVLIQNGADPEQVSDPSFAPRLRAAVVAADLRLAEALLQAGADPNARDNQGRAPLHHALRRETPLNNSQREQIVAVLLQNGADPNAPNSAQVAPIHRAAHRSAQLVRLLLQNENLPANPNLHDRNGLTPVNWALGQNADPDPDHPADIVAVLLQHGADPEQVKKEPLLPRLRAAIAAADHRLAAALLQAGANPNARDNDGRTLLHAALRRETVINHQQRVEIVRALLQAGADPNAPNNSRVAPIHRAAHRSAQLVRLLLENQADPNLQDRNGLTPLHWALGRNADPDIGDSADIVRVLINRNADPAIPDNDGQTPAQRARAHNHQDQRPDRHQAALNLVPDNN